MNRKIKKQAYLKRIQLGIEFQDAWGEKSGTKQEVPRRDDIPVTDWIPQDDNIHPSPKELETGLDSKYPHLVRKPPTSKPRLSVFENIVSSSHGPPNSSVPSQGAHPPLHGENKLVSDLHDLQDCCKGLDELHHAWSAQKKEAALKLKEIEMQLKLEKMGRKREIMDEIESKVRALREEQNVSLIKIEAEYRDLFAGIRRDIEAEEQKLADLWAAKHSLLAKFLEQTESGSHGSPNSSVPSQRAPPPLHGGNKLVSDLQDCCRELDEVHRAWAAQKKEAALRLKEAEMQLELKKMDRRQERIDEIESKVKALREEQNVSFVKIEAEYRDLFAGKRRDVEAEVQILADKWAAKHSLLAKFLEQTESGSHGSPNSSVPSQRAPPPLHGGNKLVSDLQDCCRELDEVHRAWAAQKKEAALRLKEAEMQMQLELEKMGRWKERIDEIESKVKALREEQNVSFVKIEAEYRDLFAGIRRDVEAEEQKLADLWAAKHSLLAKFLEQTESGSHGSPNSSVPDKTIEHSTSSDALNEKEVPPLLQEENPTPGTGQTSKQSTSKGPPLCDKEFPQMPKRKYNK